MRQDIDFEGIKMERKKIGSFFIFYFNFLGYGNYGKCRLYKIRNMLNEQQKMFNLGNPNDGILF